MAQGYGSYFRAKKGATSKKKQAPEYGTWWVWYPDVRGKRKAEKTLCRTKGEADVRALELAQRSERRRQGLESKGPVPTVAEVARLYRESIRHLASYPDVDAQLRLYIEPALGHLLMSEVTPAHVEALVAKHRDAPKHALQPSTLKGLVIRVGALFNWAHRKARLYKGDNPVHEATPVVVPERMPRVLSLEELERLLSAMGADRDIHLLAVLTGLRKGEIAGLQWEDVDFQRGVLTVRRSYDNPTTKGRRARVVPLAEELVELLRARKRTAKSRWVFPNPKGEVRDADAWDAAENFKAALRKAGLVKGYLHHCRRHGCRNKWELPTAAPVPCPKCGFRSWPTGIELDFTFKDLRSTFGTYMAEAKGTRAAQLLLGHSTLATTEKAYAAVRASFLREAVEAHPLRRYAAATSEGAPSPAPSQSPKKGA